MQETVLISGDSRIGIWDPNFLIDTLGATIQVRTRESGGELTTRDVRVGQLSDIFQDLSGIVQPGQSISISTKLIRPSFLGIFPKETHLPSIMLNRTPDEREFAEIGRIAFDYSLRGFSLLEFGTGRVTFLGAGEVDFATYIKIVGEFLLIDPPGTRNKLVPHNRVGQILQRGFGLIPVAFDDVPGGPHILSNLEYFPVS